MNCTSFSNGHPIGPYTQWTCAYDLSVVDLGSSENRRPLLERECPNSYPEPVAKRWHTFWNSTFLPALGHGRNKTGDIGTLLSIKFDPEDINEIYVWNCTKPLLQASACTLSWCAQSYSNARVDKGVHISPEIVEEKLVYMDETGCLEPDCTDDVADLGSFHRWQKPVPPKVGSTFIPTVVGAYRIQDAPRLDYDAPQAGQPNFFEQFRSDPKAFFVNIGDGMTISAILQKVLTTGMLIWSDEGQDGVGQALNHAGNLSASMDHLAHVMTAAIRQGPNRTRIEGTTMVMEQYIAVSWWWLMLPASLVFSSVVFLVFSIVFAAEGDRAVWKSGTIPTLFHGLSGWTDRELCKSDLEEMEKLAEEMLGRLEETSNGHLKIAKQ